MKKYFLIITLAIAAILSIIIFFNIKNEKTGYSPFKNKLTTANIGGKDFSVEIINTEQKRQLGLSGRDSLCENCAMLFVYENENIYPFWMKDMRFDLDIIWILGNKVVYLARNVPYAKGTAEAVNPGVPADKVLEMNAGTSDRLGIKIGDLVDYGK